MKKFFYIIFGVSLFFCSNFASAQSTSTIPEAKSVQTIADQLSIPTLRTKDFPGSDITIEKSVSSTGKYNSYIASYLSDGLKIYGLLTIPKGKKPANGWPAIIFNHGYVQPEVYTTNNRYVAYVDAFAKSGYVVFKPDYRGHGESEGLPESVYYSPAYTIDVLNALASIKKYQDVNPNKIGMWGHSMGGSITLRSLAVNTSSVKVAVIWGGVVAPYVDIMYHWPDRSKTPFHASPRDPTVKQEYRKQLIDVFGSPLKNPKFWAKLDPTSYVKDINVPIELHTGGNDLDVPVAFTKGFVKKLQANRKVYKYYNYPGGNHNISTPNFNLAMKRSIIFFDKYLK